MQGQRSTVTTYPDNLSFDHGSSSNDVTTDSQVLRNNMQSSVQNQLPDYRLPTSETNIQYLQHVRRDARNAEWSFGESSSGGSQHQGDRNERKTEHTWAFYPQTTTPMEEPLHGPPNIPTMDNADVHSNINQAGNGPFHFKNQRSGLTQDLNVSSGFGDQEDDAFQVVEQPSTYISVGSSTGMRTAGDSSTSFSGPSNCGEFGMNNTEEQPGSLDGHRIPCKRKTLEMQSGQSSGAGSSSSGQNAERSQWHTAPPVQIAASNVNMEMQTENYPAINNGPNQGNQRLQLSVGAVPPSLFSLTPASGNAGSSHRNVRLRMNRFHQQDPVVDGSFSMEADVGSAVASSSRHSSRSTVRNQYLDLNPPPELENGSVHGQAVQHVPAVYRNGQSRWAGTSSARTRGSSSSGISDDLNNVPYEGSLLRTIPRSILEHPMFTPANDMGNTFRGPVNWNLAGGNSNVAGNVAPPPRIGHSTGPTYTPPTHWNSRRLSEIVRRTLLSAGTEYGSQSSSHDIRSTSSAAYQEIPNPHRPEHHHRALNPRSLLDRHAALAVPYSLRTLAAAGEGRSNAMSEIRHVLDLMRRGEGLRFEDVMILDHSVLFGMAGIHDQHRDMRLDVDNMSYEELLALEERIGNVCTGLTEETIMSHMKQHIYVDLKVGQMETEPCIICQEEYTVGEDIGTLNCGHNFHRDCIKQWLLLKNLCPICKTTGLIT